MPELRWILIVVGALLLLGIYLWGRRSSREGAASEDSMLRIPESPEPQSAYVFRNEPTADFGDAVVDEATPDELPDASISANRRHIDLSDDDDTLDVIGDESVDAEPVTSDREQRRARIEPTLGDADSAESPDVFSTDVDALRVTRPGADRQLFERLDKPVVKAAPPPTEPVMPVAEPVAPTLSMSSTPPPRRTERRKIMALRIAAGSQRFTGEQLLESLLSEGLEHGKYDVFHRLSDSGVSIFSIASMVEPGTFDPPRMKDETYPGITMFAQLPGPIDSLLAFNELVLSARRLQEKLGGTLQDERGVPLTIHRVERLRQDVRDFEQSQPRDTRRADTAPTL